jgi:hypothetical protein
MKAIEQAMRALDTKYRRPGLWPEFGYVELHTTPALVVLRGALPTTMHFGSIRLELATGTLQWTDEDHRDGGDFVEQRATVTPDELAHLKSLISTSPLH